MFSRKFAIYFRNTFGLLLLLYLKVIYDVTLVLNVLPGILHLLNSIGKTQENGKSQTSQTVEFKKPLALQ